MKKITSLFQDKLFIIFLIFVFLFYIIFYQYLSLETKKEIYDTLSKPIVFVTVLCLLMFILYNHLTIGIILILAFLLSLTYGDTQKRQQDALKARKEQKKQQELQQQQQKQQQQQQNSNNLFNINKQDKHYDIQINKDFITDAYNNKIYKNGGNGPNDEGFTDFIGDTIKGLTNQLREGIKSNKKFEKELNTGDDKDDNESLDDDNDDNDDNEDDDEDNEDDDNKSNKHKKGGNGRQREDFTRILKRRFDLSDDDDKKLVYSKKILENIVNRINYKYDDKKYLKKYIGSKIEDIVDTLDLLDDDDD